MKRAMRMVVCGAAIFLHAGWAIAQEDEAKKGPCEAKCVVELVKACRDMAAPAKPQLPPEAWQALMVVAIVGVIAWFLRETIRMGVGRPDNPTGKEGKTPPAKPESIESTVGNVTSAIEELSVRLDALSEISDRRFQDLLDEIRSAMDRFIRRSRQA